MNGIIKIPIGGKERVLRFNNFASIELAKIIYDNELAKPDPDEFLKRLQELNSENHFLFMKALIYAGIIGNDYVVGFKKSVTSEQVGEWMAEMQDEAKYSVWIAFWDAMGVNIPQVNEVEEIQKKK